jgi:hypothetical protein
MGNIGIVLVTGFWTNGDDWGTLELASQICHGDKTKLKFIVILDSNLPSIQKLL